MITIAAAAAVIFLAIFPLPMRVDGDATVGPGQRAQVQPDFEGVLSKVFVHEGEAVKRGEVVAEMDAWDLRSSLGAAQAKYQAALLQMNHALASNDGGEGGIQRVKADYWKSEVARAQELLSRAQLRSPIDGVVATPHVETFAGRRLRFGEAFAEVVDTSSVVVDVAIDASDVGLLGTGEKAAIKLNSYPTRTFHGEVALVSPKGVAVGDERVFYARVDVLNPDGTLRTGMEGRAKITSGWRTRLCVFPQAGALDLFPNLELVWLVWDELHDRLQKNIHSCAGSDRAGFGLRRQQA
jgi:multidrug efflux pump subunit AcrA (membrane-fusion protein)